MGVFSSPLHMHRHLQTMNKMHPHISVEKAEQYNK